MENKIEKETFSILAAKVDMHSQRVPFYNVDIRRGNHELMEKIWTLCLQFADIEHDDPRLIASHGMAKCDKPYCITRQVGQYLGMKHTTLSRAQVGFYCARRDRTSVYNSLRAVETYLFQKHPVVTQMVRFVESNLGLSEEPMKNII